MVLWTEESRNLVYSLKLNSSKSKNKNNYFLIQLHRGLNINTFRLSVYFQGKVNESFFLEDAASLTQEFVYDNNKKICQNIVKIVTKK